MQLAHEGGEHPDEQSAFLELKKRAIRAEVRTGLPIVAWCRSAVCQDEILPLLWCSCEAFSLNAAALVNIEKRYVLSAQGDSSLW